MMATGNVGAAVQDLHRRISAIATAWISRDGQILSADLPSEVYAETFAIMCATVLGAGATASAELNRSPPDRVVLHGGDSTTVIVGSGRKAMLVAVVDSSADLARVLAEVTNFADLLGSN